MKKYWFFMIIVITILLIATLSLNKDHIEYNLKAGKCYLVVDYDAVRACDAINEPSVTLLGDEWWQWKHSGNGKPNEKFDIKVVIYGGNITKNEIEKKFPINKDQLKDYRYIEYKKIKPYFNKLKKYYKKFLEENPQHNKVFNSNRIIPDSIDDYPEKERLYYLIASCDDSWIRPSFDAEVLMESCKSYKASHPEN